MPHDTCALPAPGNFIDFGDAQVGISDPMHFVVDHGHVVYERSSNNAVGYVKLDEGERIGYTYRSKTRQTPLDAIRAALFSPEEFKEMAEPDESVRLISTISEEE